MHDLQEDRSVCMLYFLYSIIEYGGSRKPLIFRVERPMICLLWVPTSGVAQQTEDKFSKRQAVSIFCSHLHSQYFPQYSAIYIVSNIISSIRILM